MAAKNGTSVFIAMLAGITLVCTLPGVNAEEARPLKVEYERPGTDYSQYGSLLINDLDVSNTKIVPPPWKTDKPFKWNVTDKNVEALQAAFHEAMRDNISANDGYPIVAGPGPGILEISVKIVSFMPYAERDENVTTRGSGEMRIQAELRDSQTEELLAIYEGPQEVGRNYKANSDFSRLENLRGLFSLWGRRIRQFMDEHPVRN